MSHYDVTLETALTPKKHTYKNALYRVCSKHAKTLPKQPHTLIPDALKQHQTEATLPKLRSLYHKTSGINPENKC